MKKGIRFTIRRKLLFSYFLMILLLVITGLVGITYIRRVYTNGNKIYERDLKTIETLKSLSQNIKEIDQKVLHFSGGLDWEHEHDCVAVIRDVIDENQQLFVYGRDVYSYEFAQDEKTQYEQIGVKLDLYYEKVDEMIAKTGQESEAQVLKFYQDSVLPLKEDTDESIEKLVSHHLEIARQRNADNRRMYGNVIWIIAGILIVAVVIATGISISMSNHFTSKLNAIQMLARRISEYNMEDEIIVDENDEFGKTMVALNESQFMVRDIMKKIIEESATISDMGEEVSLAVRKAEQRIESANVKMLDFDEKAQGVDAIVQKAMESRALDEETMHALEKAMAESVGAKEILAETRVELSNIAIYLEQIGITSDYQNEIANSHKEQVGRFRV
ncbi:MAG: methyl-accepting chemotaxis protein [Lachnospiraceae bacterium]|nr:methyl-accepting chemotaxis protein [Lachnospiraceae bacterium]